MTETTLNRDELAQAMGVSLPTVDRWVRDGCPVMQRGGNGRPYAFDLGQVKAWRDGIVMEEQADERRRRELIAQQELELLGGVDDGLTAKDRRAVMEAELVTNKVRRERGELVESAEVNLMLERLFRTIANNLQLIPSRLEKRLQLSPSVVAELQSAIDDIQEGVARELMEFGPDA